jgi:succinylarginine dihydrolase
MWTANAATCVPSADSADGRLHIVPANLASMFHRVLEADTTTRVLRTIFEDEARFAVHDPLPGGAQFSDEGAANHTRLVVPGAPAVHLFAWGRAVYGAAPPTVQPLRFPARQSREASEALARLGQVDGSRALFPQQHPRGIDAGAFHTDVVAVGNGNVLLLHELAFVDHEALLARIRELLRGSLVVHLATEAELPVAAAVAAYPFNSQLLTLPDGTMTILAPEESREEPRARAFLEGVVASKGPVRSVRYLDLLDSMENGGGPACLRQRIVLSEAERQAVRARVFLDESLGTDLEAWVERHYRDRVTRDDLRDPLLHRESLTALDELTRVLELGPIYDFQL